MVLEGAGWGRADRGSSKALQAACQGTPAIGCHGPLVLCQQAGASLLRGTLHMGNATPGSQGHAALPSSLEPVAKCAEPWGLLACSSNCSLPPGGSQTGSPLGSRTRCYSRCLNKGSDESS